MTDPSKLDQFLTFLLDTLKDTKAFTLTQAPLLLKEALTYAFWEALLYLILGVTILLVGGTISWKLYTAGRSCGTEYGRYNKATDCYIGATFVGIFALIGGGSLTFINLLTLIQTRAPFLFNLASNRVYEGVQLMEVIHSYTRAKDHTLTINFSPEAP